MPLPSAFSSSQLPTPRLQPSVVCAFLAQQPQLFSNMLITMKDISEQVRDCKIGTMAQSMYSECHWYSQKN
jgi:hypothetical protein